MRIFKKVLLVLFLLLISITIFFLFFFNSLKPEYEGTKALAKLSDTVNVYYDDYGIPHIYAKNEVDAYRAFGYVHAQDRLWQMELLRRIAKGGLSEVFGKELMLETDKFFLTLGIDDHTQQTISTLNLDSETVKISQAYIDGINEFIKEGPTPIEFYLTGLDKSYFSLEDIYNSIGYMSFSFAMALKTDPLLSNIRNTLGAAYINDLNIDSDRKTTWIQNYTAKQKDSIPFSDITKQATKALENLPIPQFEGSNSWVLAPEKTKNNKVILANDPHIGFSQPSVWYEAHLITPKYEKYGYHIAGVPLPLLGHDRNLAYGLTMFENDDIDFYYEKTNPLDKTKYKTESGWKPYEYITKTIKVKGDKPINFTYKKTRHGPILNKIAEQITGERPVAMSWIYTKETNQVMDALYGMAHAQDIKSFSEALPKIHAPGLNVMYGDAEGNIAWWASAKLYKMPDNISTKFILDGTSGKEEPLDYLDFSENPKAINPPWNYVYSANNQPDSIAGIVYPGYYLPENRAKRIVSLLDKKNNWDKEDVSKMILDVTSSINPSMITEFLKLIDVSLLSTEQLIMLDNLKNWKGDYSLKNTIGTFYHRSEYLMLKNIFEDELGTEQFEQFLSTHLIKRQIAYGITNDDSIWWDNIHTKDKIETPKDIILKSFYESWDSMILDFGPDPKNWTWDKAHTLEHEHPMGQVSYLRKYFNVGPFPIHGTSEVINNMNFPYDNTGFYKVKSGPSTRRIIDFSDIENSISILPTGQSGNPFSIHYKDQAEMYVKGEFRKMMMNKDAIIENATNHLIFIYKK